MKCRSREEMPSNKNAVDVLLTKMMPRYLAIFPNIGDDMAKILAPKNIFEGLITGILGSARPTTELSEIEELGSFLTALYKVCLTYQAEMLGKKTIPKLESLNPELYYEENELSSINLYVKDMPKDGNIVKLFVTKNSETHYDCSRILLPEYIEYFNRGLITYNINTQRETTKTLNKKTQEVTEKITLFKNNISKMITDLQNNKFHPTHLVLSIRQNGCELYDDGGMKVGDRGWLKIQIKDKSFLDINDGMNRTMAFKEFVELVPTTKQYTGLDIFVCDEKEALEIIHQANQGEKIKEESLERRNPDNAGMKIANDLDSKSSMLKGKIATELVDIIAYNKYTDVLTLGNTINAIFDKEVADRPAGIFKLTKYLAEFYDLSIDYCRDYFEKKFIVKQDLYVRKNLIATLCCIAKIIKDDEDWQLNLFEIIDKITIDGFIEITPSNAVLKQNHIKVLNKKVIDLLKKAKKEVAL